MVKKIIDIYNSAYELFCVEKRRIGARDTEFLPHQKHKAVSDTWKLDEKSVVSYVFNEIDSKNSIEIVVSEIEWA